jgi:hypothetical protein
LHRLLIAGAAAVLLAGGPGSTSAQSPLPSVPSLPDTGIDFSALGYFWRMVDTLSRDVTPSDAQWQALLATPGYRLARRDAQLRHLMPVAFMPSRHTERDSIAAAKTLDAVMLHHLIDANAVRPDLVRFADSLASSAFIFEAEREAEGFLPAGAISLFPAPLIAFALFQLEGTSSPRGIIVDLKWLRDVNRGVQPIAHELHHSYLGHLARIARPPRDSADAPLFYALLQLPVEGIADQIDKPYPLAYTAASMQWYLPMYNTAYDNTPAILHSIDSLVAAIADNPAAMRTNGAQVDKLIVLGSHPNGAYMARTILETFGGDSLLPSVRDPFVFFHTYAAAELARGHAPPFSAKTLSVIDAEARKYYNP